MQCLNRGGEMSRALLLITAFLLLGWLLAGLPGL
jgi:hypothetical protein